MVVIDQSPTPPVLDAQSPASRVFDVLSNRYRRQLLLALLEANPQNEDDLDPLDLLSPEEGTDGLEVTQMKLVHGHLPKLADIGFIDWDRETGAISTGPNWEEISPLLELIRDHQDELPEGWLR